MKYKIERLKPGSTYIAQIRSLNDEQISDWSPAFYLTVPGDTTAPGNVGTVTATYLNNSFKFTWPAVTANSDSSIMRDFSAYVVTVSDGTNSYTLSTRNRYCIVDRSAYLTNLGSGATITASVVAVDTSGNQSATPSSGNVTAPTPAAVTGLNAVGVVGGVELTWTSVTNCDIKEYEIYAGDSAGFTPDTSTFTNRVGIADTNSFSWASGSAGATTKYFKIRAKSWYGTYSATFASDSDATVAASSDAAGQLAIENEGTSLTTNTTSIDFVGAGVVASNSGGDVTVKVAVIQTFGYTGTLATYVGNGRFYIESACTISSVRASVGTAPTGASVIIDLNKNGTTVFTTQANRPTIAASGFTSGAVTNMNITSLAAGDYLTVDIDQVGSTIAGADLTVTVVLL